MKHRERQRTVQEDNMPAESTSPTSVSGSTRLYGIMGYPIGHSLSPLMHTLAFRHHGLDAVYVPFSVAPEDLAKTVAGAVALGVAGFNVTIPHKEAIMACLDEVTDEATAIGAVNTVHVQDGRTSGHNTDGAGFLQPLQNLGTPLNQLSVCVLGAGGAARALAAALLNAGCPQLIIANRTHARSERLAADLQKRFVAAEVRAVPMSDAADAAQQSRLLVNATSLGMHEGDEPLLPSRCFGPEQIVYDIVYRPLNTPFLQDARAAGATTIGGLDMLLGQGAAAFMIWTGLAFPLEAVRPALEARLD
jgi:shikimate dehydrogenase